MVCPRCGAAFDGNFCPRCGTPAPRPMPVGTLVGTTCPRCGMVFQGNFCPRCGLPLGAAAYPMPIRQAPSGGRSTLSILWFLALIGFFLFIALNFAGLVLSPAYVVPGIQGIASGQSANQGFATGTANWTFQALNASATTGTYVPSGGPSGGYVRMTLPAGTAGGEWVQAVQMGGSAPYAAEVHLDVQVASGSPVNGILVATLESTPSGLDAASAPAILLMNRTGWTTTPNLDVSAAIGNPGTYYLKVAYIALSNPAGAEVSFDNVHLGWATDAVFYFYLPLPLPLLLYISQDPGQFLGYFGFIVAAIIASGAWYVWRDRKLTVRAFTAPLDAVGTRLRSMSAWIAVGQVWLATTFFQVALIYLLLFFGTNPSSPFVPTTENAWTLLFDYSAASVFEEIAFRAFLIGVPMAVGALIWRLAHPRPAVPAKPGGTALGALRYLWGGQLRKESSREALLVGGILVLASSLLFGLAHAPGWGWWKVLPAFVAGLGMGYVYVRHGLGAAILLHFATDGSLALSLEGIGGDPLTLVTDLMFLGLAVAGIGFFIWYLIYGWQEFQDLRRRFSSHRILQPLAAAPGAVPPASGWTYAPPPVWTQGPTYPYGAAPPASPPPPPPSGYPPPPGFAAPGAPLRPPAVPAAGRGAQIPPGYAPTYHPPPYGYPPVRFQCPFCGWVEAKYESRRFTCLRCGRTA